MILQTNIFIYTDVVAHTCRILSKKYLMSRRKKDSNYILDIQKQCKVVINNQTVDVINTTFHKGIQINQKLHLISSN